MKRNTQSGSSKIILSRIMMVIGFLMAIVGFLVFIFSMVKAENEVKNYDSYGFHLGNMLSSITNIITVAEDVSDEENETYRNLVDELYTEDEIQIEDYIACLQYANSLNLNDEKGLIQRTIDLTQAEAKDRVITGEAFWGGYAAGSIMPAIAIYNKAGIVSDKVYQDMYKRYLELMERPTEKKVYKYAQKGVDILKSLEVYIKEFE